MNWTLWVSLDFWMVSQEHLIYPVVHGIGRPVNDTGQDNPDPGSDEHASVSGQALLGRQEDNEHVEPGQHDECESEERGGRSLVRSLRKPGQVYEVLVSLCLGRVVALRGPRELAQNLLNDVHDVKYRYQDQRAKRPCGRLFQDFRYPSVLK